MTFLKIEEVCQALGLGRSSVYKLIREKQLRCHRLGPRGGRIKVTQEDVDRYLDSTLTREPVKRD